LKSKRSKKHHLWKFSTPLINSRNQTGKRDKVYMQITIIWSKQIIKSQDIKDTLPLRTNCIVTAREGETSTYREFECPEHSPFERIWNSLWLHEKSNFIHRIWTAKTKLLFLERDGEREGKREFFFWMKNVEILRKRERLDLFSGREIQRIQKIFDRCLNWTNDTAFGLGFLNDDVLWGFKPYLV
jgi:hypothetical protein